MAATDDKNTIRANGFTPLCAATATEEHICTTLSEESHGFDIPNACGFLSLALNLVCTYLYYKLNLNPNTNLDTDTDISKPILSVYGSPLLPPLILLSAANCLFCFSTLLCLRPEDRRLCLTRVGMCAGLGVVAVVLCGQGQGLFVRVGWKEVLFWAVTGVVPGAGVGALVGFGWDFWGRGWVGEGEKEQVDEKRLILEMV